MGNFGLEGKTDHKAKFFGKSKERHPFWIILRNQTFSTQCTGPVKQNTFPKVYSAQKPKNRSKSDN